MRVPFESADDFFHGMNALTPKGRYLPYKANRKYNVRKTLQKFSNFNDQCDGCQHKPFHKTAQRFLRFSDFISAGK
jgi:hypothetical protein